MGGKLVPVSQFKFFTGYHHLKVSKLDDSVFDLLRFNGKFRYQTKWRWWSSKNARVVKDDGVLENKVGRKFIDKLKRHGAALCAKEEWIMVETANIKAEDGIEKRQRVKLKLQLGASYIYVAKFTIYDVKGFDIVLGKRWMRDINRLYHINHDSNEMWIADNLWEEREDGRVHNLPGLCPLDVNEGIVEQAKFIGIHIIQKAELKNVSTRLLKWTILIKVHHRGDGNTLPTEPLGVIPEMLTEFQGPFGKPTYANSQKGRLADFEIKMNRNGKLPFRSPCRICPCKQEELRRQIENMICFGWIQPSRSNFGSSVLFLPQPDGTVRMWIDYCSVNAITVKHRYPLPHIDNLLNSMHGSCWFTNWTWWLVTIKFILQQPTGKRRPSQINSVCMSGKFCRLAWRTHPASLCT